MTNALTFLVAVFALAPTVAAAALPDGLPDFSWAGYHAGEKPLPQAEPTIDAKDFGLVGDGKADDSAALARALAKAGEKGGVVAVPPGRFVLTQVLKIGRSHVVLRGAGADKTIFICPKSLTEIRKPDPNWSWSGGLIEIRPPKGADVRVAEVGEAEAGATRLPVKWSGDQRAKVGEWLELLWHNDKGKDTVLDWLYGGVIPAGKMGAELRAAAAPRIREWVRIVSAGEDAVELAQPLRVPIRPAWKCALVRRPLLTEVGVEGLAFEFPETPYPGHLKEKGYNGIHIDALVNGWVRDVRTRFADSGIILGACKHVTVADVVLRGRTMHHPLCVSWGSDNLLTRWRIEAPHVHGTTVSWCSHGNVFSHGWGNRLAMDSHRAASFMNLHSAVTIDHGPKAVNPFRSGGSAPRGPHAARQNVYWNIDNRFDTPEGPAVIKGFDEWPLGVFAGWHGNRSLKMAPVGGMKQHVIDLNRKPDIEDLHKYQLDRRLGK